jgi:hypothetical protein
MNGWKTAVGAALTQILPLLEYFWPGITPYIEPLVEPLINSIAGILIIWGLVHKVFKAKADWQAKKAVAGE